MLLVDLRYVDLVAREPGTFIFAKAERGVVPPVEGDGTDPELGPIGELRRDEAVHELDGDVCLMHAPVVAVRVKLEQPNFVVTAGLLAALLR